MLGTCPKMILLEIKLFERLKCKNIHNLMTNLIWEWVGGKEHGKLVSKEISAN